MGKDIKNDKLKIKVWTNYEPKTQEEILSLKVTEKVINEYNSYIDYLRTLPTDEIIDRAYETTCKAEIVYAIQGKTFEVLEAKALLKENNLLHQFYDEWLSFDSNFTELLEDAIEETVELTTEDCKNELKKNKSKER